MRFIVRPGTDPIARADVTLLKAMGLPSGGVIKVGNTHVLVAGGPVESTTLQLGPLSTSNAGVQEGATVDVIRAVLGWAHTVVIDANALPLEARILHRALQGRPLTAGDLVVIGSEYLDGSEPVRLVISRVEPSGAGLVAPQTRFSTRFENDQPPASAAPTVKETPRKTTKDALLAGLDAEIDLLTGWISLLTSPRNLPAAWGLPRVAGVLLEGPNGCGKSELVAEAGARAGARVLEVLVDDVFRPEVLLNRLEEGLKAVVPPAVIFIDRIDGLLGVDDQAPVRTQVAAVLRWFLDKLVESPGTACVLGVASKAAVNAALPVALVPRSIAIPPPDIKRRRLLFEAALDRVPRNEIDYDRLAARSAGFSATDVQAAVIHATTRLARSEEKLTTDELVESIEDTTPSLGSVPLGELPSFGFGDVADLEEVKQRLTEAVIWPIKEPERFETMGIDPPRGVLLYGPPGTGKTFVVRALAHEAGAAFFSVKGAELLDMYVGESERGVRDLFVRAKAAAPAIIFFDEIDALAPVRGRSLTHVTDTVVAAMLTEIDGVSARGEVAVIGATNRKDLIDPALLRAGRFETQIELGLPNTEARLALLKISDVPFAGDVDLTKLAELTEGLSFADLSGLLREAALVALRGDGKARQVNLAHIEQALANWKQRVGAPG